MKRTWIVLFVVCVMLFLSGLAMILTSDTGVMASNMESANLAGMILSTFAGIWVSSILCTHLKMATK